MIDKTDSKISRDTALAWFLGGLGALIGFFIGWLANKRQEEALRPSQLDKSDQKNIALDTVQPIVPSAIESAPLSEQVVHYIDLIQKLLGAVIGAAGVSYLVGFVIVNFSSIWYHGFYSLDLLKTRYIGAGVFYLAFHMFILVYLYTTSLLSRNLSIIRKSVLWAAAIVLILALAFFFFSSVIPRNLKIAAEVSDPIESFSPVRIVPLFRIPGTPTLVSYYYGDLDVRVTTYILIALLMYVPMLARLASPSHHRISRRWKEGTSLVPFGWFVIGIPLLLVLYSLNIYPYLSPAVGGGAPAVVQLIVDQEELDEATRLSIGWVSANRSVPVKLLDHTRDTYVIKAGRFGERTIQIPANLVRTVIYEDIGGIDLSNAHIEASRKAISKGKPWEAIENLELALGVNPQNALAFQYQGHIYDQELHDPDKALSAYLNAVRLSPSLYSTHWRLGGIFLEKGELELARQHREQSVSLTKSLAPTQSDWVHSGLGLIHLASSDLDSGIEELTEAYRLNPDEMNASRLAEAYVRRGSFYLRRGGYEQAIKDYQSAIGLTPESLSTYRKLGMAYSAQGDFTSALKIYDEMVDIDPFNSSGYLGRGVAFLEFDEFDRAIAEFQRAVELSPNQGDFVEMLDSLMEQQPVGVTRADYYNQRGVVRFQLGDLVGALADFDQGLELDPDFAWIYSNRGVVYSSLGLYHDAIEDFGKAIKLLEGQSLQAIPLTHRGDAYRELWMILPSVDNYESAIRLMPNLPWPYMAKSETYARTGQERVAIGEIDKAIAIGTLPSSVQRLLDTFTIVNSYQFDSASLYSRRSQLHWTIRDYDQAVSDMEKAVELDPTNRSHLLALGNRYKDSGQVEEALASYVDAVEKWPDHPMPHYQLASLLVEQQRWEQAEEELRTVLELSPGFTAAYCLLGDLYRETGKIEKARELYTTCSTAGHSETWHERAQRELEKLSEDES